MRADVAVVILAHGVNAPTRILLGGDAEHAILIEIVKRRDVHGDVIAHGSVLGIIGVTLVGADGELRLAVDERPRAHALAAGEGRVIVKIGAARDGVGAGRGGHANGVPQPGERGRRLADAGDAEAPRRERRAGEQSRNALTAPRAVVRDGGIIDDAKRRLGSGLSGFSGRLGRSLSVFCGLLCGLRGRLRGLSAGLCRLCFGLGGFRGELRRLSISCA